MNFSNKEKMNRLPKRVRLICMIHLRRLYFDKKFGGYKCKECKVETTVRVLNFQ